MHVIDSHTGGQPTRIILSGGPELGAGPLSERARIFTERFDHYRMMSVLEPKCSDAVVGGLLCEPHDRSCTAGVIFFNTAGVLGMCGHGTIGLAATLAWLGRIDIGRHRIDTPVGVVDVNLLGPNQASISNVESYCLDSAVAIDVAGLGHVTGSIAWGGNWFFLADESPVPITPANIPALTNAAWAVRHQLAASGLTGFDGAEIDHIEFFEKGRNGADSRNFVLCPGGAYDRSPCGTGTSAKLACLAAQGKLSPGEVWVQESVIGSRFRGAYQHSGRLGRVRPTITGEAYIFADATLIFQDNDPFCRGVT